jgi:adhesin transport system membrane fusion protein
MFGNKEKPIKTIQGNDPNLAKAIAAQMAQQQGAKKQPTMDENIDRVRQGWMQNQVGKVAAHAEKFFSTDEELSLSSHFVLLSICGFFILFFLWASFAKLEETTRGEGRIIPSKEIQKISSLEGGIIDKIMIKEGDEVKAGQTLVQLRDIAASSDLGSNEARYLGLLAAVTRLQAEVEGKVPQFPDEVMKKAPQAVTEEMNAFRANQDKINSQTIILQQQKSQRQQELNELQIKSSDVNGQLALAREEKAMVEPLVARGSAPRMELLQIDRSIKEKQTELNSVNSAVPRARSAIAEADARIRDVVSQSKAAAQTELSAKMVEMSALKQGLVNLEDRKTRTEIKSPVNGYIKDLKVYTVGGVVQPGQDFIEIVPKDDQLLVEARIKPKDIAFLYPEQDAMVKITAYDFSIYGGLKGKVVAISPDAITDEKGESFYLVRILTQENALKRKNEVLPIIPGMVATVDILTGEKTVMEYLLKPFIKTLSSSLHER